VISKEGGEIGLDGGEPFRAALGGKIEGQFHEGSLTTNGREWKRMNTRNRWTNMDGHGHGRHRHGWTGMK
jgi:hypothetical protein